jgi:hypothetical protein
VTYQSQDLTNATCLIICRPNKPAGVDPTVGNWVRSA